MNFTLFGTTIFVVDIKFGLFWAIHSASEFLGCFSFCFWEAKGTTKPLAKS